MQAQETKGELIVEVHGKTTTTTIKDISPAGARLEHNILGEVKGKYHGTYMQTTSTLRKPDGSSEWDAKFITLTKEGDTIVGSGKGTAQAAGPAISTVTGEFHYMTTSKSLAWLNNTTGRVEGTYNRATGETSGKVYSKK